MTVDARRRAHGSRDRGPDEIPLVGLPRDSQVRKELPSDEGRLFELYARYHVEGGRNAETILGEDIVDPKPSAVGDELKDVVVVDEQVAGRANAAARDDKEAAAKSEASKAAKK